MFEFLTEAFKALAGYPIIQVAVAIMVLLVGIHVMRRGEQDRKSGNGNGQATIPSWAMYGPVHEVMQAAHQINERSAKQCDLLERIEAHLDEIAKTSSHSKAALEMIRNESRLR